MSAIEAPSTLPELSIVAPLHNEQENACALFTAICVAIEPLGRPFEVLLVNDGSSDATGRLLDEMAAKDNRLKPIHLDGNFGEAAALCAGFERARGGVILTLDGDLQNDPADLPRLLALLEKGEYRAVSGWRRQRQEQFIWRVLPSRIANWLIARVTGVPSQDNGCGLKAYRAEVVKGVYLPHGLHRFMPAVFGVRPEEFAQIEVTDRRRQAGRSHYGLSRLFAVLRDLLVIPYLPESARAAFCWMNLLAGLGLLIGLGAALLLFQHLPGAALGLAISAGMLLAYVLSVRANLQRWLRAQSEKTFRIRSTASGTEPPRATELRIPGTQPSTSNPRHRTRGLIQ
jgi:glycosyltransferase involved in cell wall biosynthesis